METLHEAYRAARKNDGAPGIDGVTFDAIEEGGVESFLQQIKDELVSNTRSPRTRCGIVRLQRFAVRSQLPFEPVCPLR